MFAKRLKELRNEKNLTQGGLGKILNLSPSTIGMYERGEREPHLEILINLSKYFGVTADYILGLTFDKNHLEQQLNTDSHNAGIAQNKENFPTEKADGYAPESLDISDKIQAIVISQAQLDFLLKAQQLGITIQDLDILTTLKKLLISVDSNK